MQDNKEDRDELDSILMKLINEGAIEMEWNEEKQDFVFWMNDEQKAEHDASHPG